MSLNSLGPKARGESQGIFIAKIERTLEIPYKAQSQDSYERNGYTSRKKLIKSMSTIFNGREPATR